MSVFTIKIILVIFMFGDHLAAALVYSDIISPELIILLRSAGRFVFPVYAYLVANGFHHSKDRKKYLNNLIIFAALSQIPFLMLVSKAPFGVPISMAFNISFSVTSLLQYFLVCIFLLFCYYLFISKKLLDLAFTSISLALAALTLSVSGGRFYASDLNVLYTFAVAVVLMMTIEVYKKNSLSMLIALLASIASALCLLYLGLYSDYNLLGVALVVFIHMLGLEKINSIIAVGIFCLIHYVGNSLFLPLSLISVVIIFLYNGKKGYHLNKYFFYAFYPVHLLAIGIFRFFG